MCMKSTLCYNTGIEDAPYCMSWWLLLSLCMQGQHKTQVDAVVRGKNRNC